MLTNLSMGSQGMQLNRMLDALGLPDHVGDAIGAHVDAAKGDMAGYLRNITDLTSGLDTASLDTLFGKGLPSAHFIDRPQTFFPKSRKLWGHTFSTAFGDMSIERQQLGGAGKRGRRIGRRLERAMLRSPAFKAQLEQILGGQIIMDGRMDGRITVQRYTPKYTQVPLNNKIQSNPQLSGLYGALSRLEGNITQLAGSLTKSDGSGGSVLSDPDTKKLADGMGMKPPLAFEDMLFLMMMKYGRNKEKEIMGKMNELSGKQGNINDAGQPMGTFGGLVGGPAQAAFGQQAAQILSNPNTSNQLKQAQMAQLVNQFQAAGAGTGVAGGSGQAGVFGNPQETSDTLKQMQLQKMMEDLKKMYEMLSNVMKSMHSMQMTAVRNLR